MIANRYSARRFVNTLFIWFCTMLVISCETGPDLSNVNRSSASNANSAAAELELSGDYAITGADENGQNPYEGTLDLRNEGDAYKVLRQTKTSRTSGVGVQMGDALAAVLAEGDQGKGCGVMLYKISPNGSLDGKMAKWGEYSFGTEKAVRTEGTSFVGKYAVTGRTNDGKDYQGNITIEKMGSGYFLTWNTPVVSGVGFGIWRGDRAAIGFGGKQCTFAIYKVNSAKSLDGFWGSQRAITFGTETAKKS